MIVKEPEWNSADAIALRDFLATPTGRRFMDQLAYNRPSFFKADADPQRSFARSREIAGFEDAISTVLSLTEEKPFQPLTQDGPSRGSYPDLDDESQWPQEPA